MKNSSRFILLMLLLVFSWWLQDLFTKTPELLSRDKSRFANYFFEDFKLTAYDKNGQPSYTLKAKRLDHFEQESLAEIQQIHAEFYNQQSSWTVTANAAKLYENENRIEFIGDVKIERPQQAEDTAFSFYAQQMTLLTDKEILLINDHVVVNSNAMRIESNGLRYDVQQGILELQANVKVTYVK